VEGRPLNEQEQILRAKNGDVAAFEMLVRAHQQIALRVAYLVLWDDSVAEDVTQEAFVKAYRALPRFRDDAAFRPWLLRIVRNEALNQRRRRGRQERDVVSLRYLLGLSEAETAVALGVPVGTVKSRTARALDRLESNLTVLKEDRDD
jgi:RNA polymerase sigma-70 factor (ECF subfamily)